MTAIPFLGARSVGSDVRWSARPLLVAIAAMNAMTGLVIAAILAPRAFGADADFYRSCAQSLADGGGICGSLYPPLVAIVARPLTWVSAEGAAVAMTVIGVTLLSLGVALETRGHSVVDRVLVGVAAFGFAPVVHELVLGQVTLLIAAALYPIVRQRDGFRTGLLLGAALALAPKPLLLPVLVWMLFHRRHALAASLLAAAVLTVLGLLLVGVDQYRQWVSVLGGAGSESVSGTLPLSLSGNFSLWPLDPFRLLLAGIVAAVTLGIIVRDEARGFVAALLAGLLLAPYTGLYAAAILVLAVRPALAFAPRATRLLALVANPVTGFLLALPAWCIGSLVACLPFTARRSRPADAA